MAIVKDPVCGAEVDTDGVNTTVGELVSGASETDPSKGTKGFHEGEWIYFDSLVCRVKFMTDPKAYLSD